MMHAMLDDATLLQRRSQPLSAAVDAETVMFDAVKGSYYALGFIGTRIWELLQEPIELHRLRATLQAEFEVDEATCRRDTEAFLQELRAADLVEVRA